MRGHCRRWFRSTKAGRGWPRGLWTRRFSRPCHAVDAEATLRTRRLPRRPGRPPVVGWRDSRKLRTMRRNLESDLIPRVERTRHTETICQQLRGLSATMHSIYTCYKSKSSKYNDIIVRHQTPQPGRAAEYSACMPKG